MKLRFLCGSVFLFLLTLTRVNWSEPTWKNLSFFLLFFLVLTHFIFSLTLAIGCIFCAKILHDQLLNNVMHWPMELFDVTPLGRIINRFAKDIDTIDLVLPLNWRVVISQAFSVITQTTISFYHNFSKNIYTY